MPFKKIKKAVSSAAGGIFGGGLGSIGSIFLPGKFGQLAGALGSTASAYGAYQATKEGAKQQNEWAKEAAAKQMQFQAGMYGNRYLKQMKDMERAGLNPILSYAQAPPGGPAGASYSPVNTEAGALPAVNSAEANRRSKQQTAVMAKTIEKMKSDIANVEADTDKKAQEMMKAWHEQGLIIEQSKIARANVNAARAAAEAARIDKRLYQGPGGDMFRLLEKSGSNAGALGSLLTLMRLGAGAPTTAKSEAQKGR